MSTDPSFWLDRWAQGETPWQRDAPHPCLVAHASGFGLDQAPRVLVPLCGATLDLAWLRAQGAHPVGVELSPIACARFFDRHGLPAVRTEVGPFTAWSADDITILQGDVLHLGASGLPAFDALYDRAATIALPSPLRHEVAAVIASQMVAGAPGLLITLDDPSRGDEGPPFHVGEADVRAAWARHAVVAAREPVEGQSASEAVWWLTLG